MPLEEISIKDKIKTQITRAPETIVMGPKNIHIVTNQDIK
jgi:hypothetical protein